MTLAIPLLALATGLHLFGQTSSWAAAVDIAPQHAGALFGLTNALAQITGAIAPIATPYIAAKFGWTAALDFSAGMVTLAGLLWLLVRPDRPLTATRS